MSAYGAVAAIAFGTGLALGAVATTGNHDNAARGTERLPPAEIPHQFDPARRIVIGGNQHHQFYEYVTFTGPRGSGRFLCLFDTGASALTLNQGQASQVGYDPRHLDYSIVIATANGRSRAAPVRLASVSIAGRYTVTDEPAEVDAGDNEDCLVGMSLLRRLRVEIEKDSMNLKW